MKLMALFFISFTVFAQVEDEFDLSVVDKLRARERKTLNQVLKAKEKKYNRIQKEALKVQLADILSSPIYLGHALKGSLLIELESDEQILLNKDINVRAHTLPDRAGYIYLKNDKGVTTHKTLGSNVTRITEITRMHEPPPFYEPVVKKEVVKYEDDGFKLFTELNLHLGLTNPNFTRDLVNDSTQNPGQAIKYELQTYSPFTLPFSIGASLMFESVNGDLGGGDSYSVSSLSLGPIVKSPKFSVAGHDFTATAGVRASLFSKIKEARAAQAADYRLTQTSLFLGLQKDFKLALGEFVLGANFQRQWSKASSDNFAADLESDSLYDDSFSFSFGHKMEWL